MTLIRLHNRRRRCTRGGSSRVPNGLCREGQHINTSTVANQLVVEWLRGQWYSQLTRVQILMMRRRFCRLFFIFNMICQLSLSEVLMRIGVRVYECLCL